MCVSLYIRLITRVRVEYGELFHEDIASYFHEPKASANTAFEITSPYLPTSVISDLFYT